MPEEQIFQGFTRATVRFFVDLKTNNNKQWFEQHRMTYETQVLEPAKAFVRAMAPRLKTISQNIIAVPKINKSLFRINRDTRFSLDPSPYKTNLGIYFWEGGPSRLECSGFYFGVEPPKMMLGAGYYLFPDRVLEIYRRAVVHPKYGPELTRILKSILKTGEFELGGKHYKRVPAGFDQAHPNAQWLLHNGLYASWEANIPKEFFGPELRDFIFQKCKAAAPLHKWLVALSTKTDIC
jgi:uncharacterized protein (TIGR02453 family)